ncbi:MAG: hypothetical protein ACRCTI_04645, partial [Beijerinckiaceae bacterium]
MTARTGMLAAMLLLASFSATSGQQRDEEEGGWVGMVDGLEACLADKRPLLTRGQECIGRFS